MTIPTTRCAPVAVMLAALVALASVIMAPAIAAAQVGDNPIDRPSLTASSHALTDESSLVVSVALDVAGADVGALSAILHYDRSVFEYVSCTPGDTAVCNEVDGEVHFAGFDIDGFVSDDRFLELELAVLDRPTTSSLQLTIVTAADSLGGEIDSLSAESGTVTFLAPATPLAAPTGGINGEVLDGAGVGVFGAQVCATSPDAEQVCTVTTGLGAFVLDGVTVGSHTLVASDPTDVLPTTAQIVEVADGVVTTGVSLQLVVLNDPEVQTQILDDLASDDPAAGDPAVVEDSALPVAPVAQVGEIVVQVSARSGGFAVFGAEVCATMPLIGTQACGFSDGSGVVRLADMGIGNYELSAVDPASRFDAATPTFVGLNPGEGVNATLELPALGLGDAPEALAFVESNSRSETAGVVLTGVALMALSAVAVGRRHRGDSLGK